MISSTFLRNALCSSRLLPWLRWAVVAQTTDDGQWTMPGKDYAATRYSGLAEINAQNAKGLHPVWTFSTGVLGGHQGQPLVVKNTMYVVTPYPERAVCVRSHQGRLPAQVEVSSGGEPERHRDRLLRFDQSRRVLRRREDHLQPARRTHGGGGRRNRSRSVDDQDCGHGARARPRRWRRSWPRTASSSAPPAASSGSTAG